MTSDTARPTGSVRCNANPWSDWCQRGKPIYGRPLPDDDHPVCPACRAEARQALAALTALDAEDYS